MEPSHELSSLVSRATSGLRDPHTWRSLAYVFGSLFTALAAFIVAVLLVLPALVLCLLVVGVPLTVMASTVLDHGAGPQRGLTSWLGPTVARRSFAGGSWKDRFRDIARWRVIGFGFGGVIATALILAVALAGWALPLYLLSLLIWGWAIDSFSTVEIVGQALAGAGLLLVAPVITQAMANLHARFVHATLGPDRLAEMERRVTDLTANRDEILHAVAGERRRIERNLHDGVQQQLVALGIDLGLAQAKLDSDPDAARALLADATTKARESIGELRSIGRGLHPAILDDRGLDAALSAVVATSAVPIDLRTDLAVEPPIVIAEAIYFIVSEAVTNVMKHSSARLAVVEVRADAEAAEATVYDDGRGGAHLGGTGLAGVAARVSGMNGTFELDSPPGGPTTLRATLPCTLLT